MFQFLLTNVFNIVVIVSIVPPPWRHPQIPLFAQTGMPNHDLFSLFVSIITFEQMTIKHSMYMQKVPF